MLSAPCELGIGVRRVAAQVTEARSPEDGIGQGVGHGVGVAVADESPSPLTGHHHPAQDQGPVGVVGEAVDVEAVADPQPAGPRLVLPAPLARPRSSAPGPADSPDG